MRSWPDGCARTLLRLGEDRGETLRGLGLGCSIFGDAGTAAEERGQPWAEPGAVGDAPSERGALLWLHRQQITGEKN